MTDLCLRSGLPGFVLHGSPEDHVRDLRRAHAWFCDLDRDRPDAATFSLLAPEEWARAMRLKRLRDRKRYVARHAFVRRVLANLLERPAGTIELTARRCGKPTLAQVSGTHGAGHTHLEFSVSCSENVLGLVATAGREVGIDLEIVRPIPDAVELAADLLPGESVDALALRTGPERDLLFYRLWTRNEAWTKLQGRGLDCPHTHEPPRIERWTVRPFSLHQEGRRIVGAVALEKRVRGGRTTADPRPPTPSELPSPSAEVPCSRTSGIAWPAARSARSTACRSS